MSIGPLRHSGLIERAVVARLRERMPAYTAEVMAQEAALDGSEPRQLPDLRGIIRVSELEHWPEDQKPLAVVVAAGTATDPVKEGDGTYRAPYSVVVAIVVGARDDTASRDLGQWYSAAVRGCLLQGRSLDGVVEIGVWTGESFDDLDPDDRRTMFGSLNSFTAELREVVNWQNSPQGPWTATSVDVTVDSPLPDESS